jgi:hypothetical protein
MISSQLATERLEIPPFDTEDAKAFLLNLLARPETLDEKSAAAQLTAKLGGHPLAISQMAAIIKSRNYSISNFNDAYDKNRKKIHRTHHCTLPARYDHFLDTVWRISFDFLQPRGRALLGVISIISPDSIPSKLFLCGESDKPPANMEFCEDAFR